MYKINFFRREIPDFSVHICPRGEISSEATQIHGIEKKSGRLILRGDPVSSVDTYQGLEMFQKWILKNFYENSVVLVCKVWIFIRSYYFSTTNTVKPVYNDQPRETQKVVVVHRQICSNISW